ncbi:MAG: hypothetical protein EXQ93_06380 [Alphaproteobacteria bacterium]|nr:hypothetical protein [Alphaproteobacteria bacterium]
MQTILFQMLRRAAVLAALALSFVVTTAQAQVATDRSVAVLLTGVNDEGVHAAATYWTNIAKAISKEATIRVADDASVEAFANKTLVPQEAAAALKVRFVIIGAVTAGDHNFKFDLKMFDGKDGKQVWASIFLSDEDNILIVPTEMGSAAITQLRALTL